MSCLICVLFNLTAASRGTVLIFLGLVDVIFLIHMFLQFHMYYVDPESGIKVTDGAKIRKRYAKSFMFWVDLIGMIPFHLLALPLVDKDAVIFRTLTTNHVLRGLHLITFYNEAKKKLYLSISLQWTYVLYLVCYGILVMSSTWHFFTCPEDTCTFRISSGPKYSYHKTDSHIWSILLAVSYIVGIFTSCSLPTTIPTTWVGLLLSQLYIITSIVIIGMMLGTFISLLVINGITWNQYERKMSDLVRFAKDRGLSVVLVDKIHAYMLNLWTIRSGELIPHFVKEAPPYLREKVMCSIYGYHLTNSDLFKHTHTDFLRQLTLHLQVCMYPIGQIIVEKGDIDESMYFIHKGEVRVVDYGREEIKESGTSFGEKQGVQAVAHTRTYMAHTTADILILKRSDWQYLLDWFPASKEIIFDTLNSRESEDTSSNYSFGSEDFANV